jgi:hypothetical protein
VGRQGSDSTGERGAFLGGSTGERMAAGCAMMQKETGQLMM